MVPFKIWMIMEKREILDHIKVPLQSVQQTKTFSCGNAALRSIFQYYKVGPEDEGRFIKMMKSNYNDGTLPENIVATAMAFGLCVKQQHNLTIAKLKKLLDQERPVVIPMQAWGSKHYYSKRESGHYVVAIGYDEENIFFEDPVLKGRRGYLPYDEFNERWHDKDANGDEYDHYGIVIWKKDGLERNAKYLSRAKKID